MRGRVSAKIVNCAPDPRVNIEVRLDVRGNELYKSYDDVIINFSHSYFLLNYMTRGSGHIIVVFGLVTPLDHPPETPWFTLYIYNI